MLIIDTPLKNIRRPLDTSKTWAENILAAHPQLLDPDFTTISLNGKRIKNRKFDFYVHSQNPIGAEWINKTMAGMIKNI